MLGLSFISGQDSEQLRGTDMQGEGDGWLAEEVHRGHK